MKKKNVNKRNMKRVNDIYKGKDNLYRVLISVINDNISN